MHDYENQHLIRSLGKKSVEHLNSSFFINTFNKTKLLFKIVGFFLVYSIYYTTKYYYNFTSKYFILVFNLS